MCTQTNARVEKQDRPFALHRQRGYITNSNRLSLLRCAQRLPGFPRVNFHRGAHDLRPSPGIATFCHWPCFFLDRPIEVSIAENSSIVDLIFSAWEEKVLVFSRKPTYILWAYWMVTRFKGNKISSKFQWNQLGRCAGSRIERYKSVFHLDALSRLTWKSKAIGFNLFK